MVRYILPVLFSFLSLALCDDAESVVLQLQQVFSNRHAYWFEGHCATIEYEFHYPPEFFNVQKDQAGFNIIERSKALGNKWHSLQVFNNEGAGFPTAEEAWKEVFSTSCTNCKEIKFQPIFAGTLQAAYENDKELHLVIGKPPGFWHFKLEKPADLVLGLVKQIQIRSECSWTSIENCK